MKALWIKIVLLAVALPGVWGNVAAQVTISADFDTGSIGSVRRIDSVRMLHAAKNSLEVMSFGIRSRIDPLNPVDTALLPSSRWFHFRLEGVKGKLMFLRIPNTEMVRPFYSYDGEEYLRFDAGECSLPQTVYKYFLHDTVYVAYFLPYSHARHKAKADEWACSPFVRRQRIGRSGEGRPIEMLILTDATVPDSLKRRVWIHSRVHTSEAPAAWYLEAMIDELLSDAPLSREILRRTVFYVVPETNPDGVRGGYSRSTAQGVNLEINWDRLHAAKNSLEVMSFGIRSRIDPLNPVDTALLPSSRWFHFRLEGVKGKLMFLRIPNTEMVRPFYSYDGEEYLRFDAGECSLPQTVYKYFLHDTVYVAYFLPYSHARHKAKADEWACSPFVRRQRIGRSGEGRPIEMLILTDATVPDSLKRRVWIHSRVHTSEAPAAWYLEAMIDELLSDAPLSREILRRTVFYVVPETNPDGVRGGYSRSTAQGVNLEINWDRPDSLTQPEVRVLKRTIDSLSTERPFDVALNLHSQSAPFVTYWIHTAKSTSAKMYRRKMLLSALTVAHTPYYRPIDQRFSEAAPRYAEGWFWQRFGERTLAVTFETPYTYYNNDPAGEWVSRESLAELAHASLLALSDLLDLGGSERRQADSERMKARGKWLRRTAKDRQFFGGSYLVAERKGASVSFVFPDVAEGRYEVFKWIPGPLDKKFAREENRWQPIGEVVQEQAGRLVWRYQAAAPGDVLDVILLVPKSER